MAANNAFVRCDLTVNLERLELTSDAISKYIINGPANEAKEVASSSSESELSAVVLFLENSIEAINENIEKSRRMFEEQIKKASAVLTVTKGVMCIIKNSIIEKSTNRLDFGETGCSSQLRSDDSSNLQISDTCNDENNSVCDKSDSFYLSNVFSNAYKTKSNARFESNEVSKSIELKKGVQLLLKKKVLGKVLKPRFNFKSKVSYECPICKKQFSYAQVARNHSRICNSFTRLEQNSMSTHTQASCSHSANASKCSFSTNFSGGEILCKVCRKHFTSQKTLNQHTKDVHGLLKSYKCDVCDRSFARKSGRDNHLDSVHRLLKPFSCDVCRRKFSRKATRDEHVDTVNRLLKPYKCELCCKSFARNHKKADHMKRQHKTVKYKLHNV